MGTNVDEHTLTEGTSEEDLFNSIQETLRTGSSGDLDKLMETELKAPEQEPVVVEEPIVAAEPAPTKEEEVQAPKEEPQADWLTALPDDVKERVKALKDERDQFEHRVKSELGRVPALQRKVDELSRKLTEPRPAQIPAADTQKGGNTPSKLQERIAQIRLVDPLLADALEDIKSEIAQPLREELGARIENTTQLVRMEQEEALFSRENEKLLAAVPRAHDVFKLPVYREWVGNQTDGIKTLAASMYADDVVMVLEKFAKEMQAAAPQAPATTPAAPAAAPNPQASKVLQERERKLGASAPSAVSGVAKTGDGLPTDPEALFSYYANKLRKGEM